jgi:cation diffusion facilitator CzcD-associated flavoprotein CzcO
VLVAHAVIVIGSGFAGLIAAIRLRRMGIRDVVILERRDVPGGTWYENSYPGAAVDVQSPLYCLAGEPYPWSRMFAEQDELCAYTDHVIDSHDLRRDIVTKAEVEEARWSGTQWRVRTRDGRVFTAQFLVNASGPLSTPALPDLPGRGTFSGASFHSSQWDHSVDYRGQRVAVVGTGASAAQIVPAIQPHVAELHVFQRTPVWVLPRPDRTFSERQRRWVADPAVQRGLRTAIYWSLEARVLGLKYSRQVLSWVGERPARRHLERQVDDAGLRRRLTPEYAIGCKRVVLSNTYYPALAASGTTLHDRNDQIARVRTDGVLTTMGEVVHLDTIVWATGFQAAQSPIPHRVLGRDGVELHEVWQPHPWAYLGTTVPGFPNLFILAGPNTGTGHTSALFMIESQMIYAARCIREVLDADVDAIEVTPAAAQRYNDELDSQMQRTVWLSGGCRSWYQADDGHVVAMYPGFSFSLRRQARRFRRADHILGTTAVGSETAQRHSRLLG